MNENTNATEKHMLPLVRTKLNLDIPLFSEEPVKTPQDVVNMLGSYMADLAAEVAAVVCFDGNMCPICVALIGAGDFTETPMPARNIIQTALLSNAAAVAVVHNHPSSRDGSASASLEDVQGTIPVMKACRLMNIQFFDSIILTHQIKKGGATPLYYSMREKKIGIWKKINIDRYEKGVIKSTLHTENTLPWDDDKDDSNYWGTDVTKLREYPQITTYTSEELSDAVALAKNGALGNGPLPEREPVTISKMQQSSSSLSQREETEKEKARVLAQTKESLGKIREQMELYKNSPDLLSKLQESEKRLLEVIEKLESSICSEKDYE